MGWISRIAPALSLAPAFVLMVGCAAPPPNLAADQFVFEFHSQPEGAMLYWGGGTAIGAAPYVSSFKVSPVKLAQEVVSEKFIVVWPSGARLETVKTWRPRDNKKWRFTLSRPPNAPGMDVDLKHAATLEATRLARAQAQRAAEQDRDAAAASILDAYGRGRYGSGGGASPSIDMPIRCNSYRNGNNVQTTCN